MTQTTLTAIACCAILAVSGLAHAQGTSSDSAASAGKPSAKERRAMSRSTTTNAAGVSTPNSTGATSGTYTQSGAVAPTTPDPMQIKNARDGSPMKTSKGASAPSK